MGDRSALVIIDVQRGLIEGFEDDWREVLQVIGDLGARARKARVPVVLVQHCGAAPSHPLHRSQPGWAVHPSVNPQPEDVRVEKSWSDAFRGTDLDARLRDASVTRLVIVGAQTEYCVDTTARRALTQGYDVLLVSDAHTTLDSKTLSAEQIITFYNHASHGFWAGDHVLRVRPASEIAF